jgi:DNA polymerase III delta prime subunit
MKINPQKISAINISQKINSINNNIKDKAKYQEDSVSISEASKKLYEAKNHPDLKIEKTKISKRLIEEEQYLSKEKVRVGIKKMILAMLSR